MSAARPSIVTTFLPAARRTGVTHDRTASPSRWTVQAPHRAMPQPNLVPVRPSVSRMTHSSGVSSGDVHRAVLAIDVEVDHRRSLPMSLARHNGATLPNEGEGVVNSGRIICRALAEVKFVACPVTRFQNTQENCPVEANPPFGDRFSILRLWRGPCTFPRCSKGKGSFRPSNEDNINIGMPRGPLPTLNADLSAGCRQGVLKVRLRGDSARDFDPKRPSR